MHYNLWRAPVTSGKIKVLLDGLPVNLPAEYRTLNAIRCRLEAVALASQRILSSLTVDGRPVNLALPMRQSGTICLVEARTIALRDSSILVLKQALQQTEQARDCVETALTLVLINEAPVARELWWNLAPLLKEPVLSLSLLPDDACGSTPEGALPNQLRHWQLEQLAAIIQDAEAACQSDSTIPLSNALENRVLPWLDNLRELIRLWLEAATAKARLELNHTIA
ncbi:MAG: hypothetical protein ABSE16_02825 [Verrucomicrobiota bacterium]|jgi:hypothetical protein